LRVKAYGSVGVEKKLEELAEEQIQGSVTRSKG
jgi:hypothetical protein